MRMRQTFAYWSLAMGTFFTGLGGYAFFDPPAFLASTPFHGKLIALLIVIYGSYRFFYGYRILKRKNH